MATALDQGSLFDTGCLAWLAEQVAHLRAGRLAKLEVANVVQEPEDLKKSQRHPLENHLEGSILNLLKRARQPDQRSRRWRATVQEPRSRSGGLLRESPSLKREVEPMCRDVHPDAVGAAVIETLLREAAFPQTEPCTVGQIFERALPADELPEPRSTRKSSR